MALSQQGRARAELLLAQPWAASLTRIVSSGETKALETAAILAATVGLDVERRDDTGEIDRSSPGSSRRTSSRLSPTPASPTRSAAHAAGSPQPPPRRGSPRALADLLDAPGEIAVVGHGGVGTLWYCHLAELPIERRWDQPGQGHWFTVDGGRPVHHWRPIEDVDP